jgi:hypothetical protein
MRLYLRGAGVHGDGGQNSGGMLTEAGDHRLRSVVISSITRSKRARDKLPREHSAAVANSREAPPLRPGTRERRGSTSIYMVIYYDRSELHEDFFQRDIKPPLPF